MNERTVHHTGLNRDVQQEGGRGKGEFEGIGRERGRETDVSERGRGKEV